MVKSVIKEIFIIILLILAILLVLGVMFYDYRPSTKTIPTAVAEYRLSADIQEELDETIKASEVQNIIKTYYIEKMDKHKIIGRNTSSGSSGNTTQGQYFNNVK